MRAQRGGGKKELLAKLYDTKLLYEGGYNLSSHDFKDWRGEATTKGKKRWEGG